METINNPQYMVVPPQVLALMKEVEAEYQRWRIDLFTPKGLELLFRRENDLRRPTNRSNQAAMGS